MKIKSVQCSRFKVHNSTLKFEGSRGKGFEGSRVKEGVNDSGSKVQGFKSSIMRVAEPSLDPLNPGPLESFPTKLPFLNLPLYRFSPR